MIFGTITYTLERSTLTTIPFSCLFSSMSKLLVFFFPSFFSSSLYLVHSFCLTKRKGEARKRTLTCYLVSSCPTHFSGGTGLQTVITDECSNLPSPLFPIGLFAQSQRSRVRIPYKPVFFLKASFSQLQKLLIFNFHNNKKITSFNENLTLVSLPESPTHYLLI